jgi:hypothetical protein
MFKVVVLVQQLHSMWAGNPLVNSWRIRNAYSNSCEFLSHFVFLFDSPGIAALGTE